MYEVRNIANERKFTLRNPIRSSCSHRHIRIRQVNLYGLLREVTTRSTIEGDAGDIA